MWPCGASCKRSSQFSGSPAQCFTGGGRKPPHWKAWRIAVYRTQPVSMAWTDFNHVLYMSCDVFPRTEVPFWDCVNCWYILLLVLEGKYHQNPGVNTHFNLNVHSIKTCILSKNSKLLHRTRQMPVRLNRLRGIVGDPNIHAYNKNTTVDVHHFEKH